MSDQPARDPVLDLLDSTQRETHDLLSAICQSHVERVRDLLGRDLRDQIGHIIDERFSQLELALRPRMARARLDVARGLAQVLNDSFARIRRFDSDREWCEAMLDAAGALSRRAAFFSVRGEDLCLQSARGLESTAPLPPAEVPYKTAPAFERVITSARTHSVTRNAAELSLPIAAMFGSDTGARALLVPVSAGDRVPGVLYAEDAVDSSAIELVAGMAGAVLEKHLRMFESVRTTGGPVRNVGIKANGPRPDESSTALAAAAPPPVRDPRESQAERYARVEIARLLLSHAETISQARQEGRIYSSLRPELDALRSGYHSRFSATRDYLHAEVVRTLALNDAAMLGKDYPNPAA